MNRRPHTRLLALAMAGLIAAMAGCAPDDEPEGDEPEVHETPIAEPEPESEPAAEDEPAENDSPQADSECLATTWLLDNESWRLMLADAAQQSGGTLESVTGELVLDLRPDGTFSSEYSAWSVTTVVNNGRAVIERNGVDSGIWSHDSATGTLELIEDDLQSTITGYIEDPVNGRTPLPPTGDDGEATFELVEYICGADDLLITLSTGTVFFAPLG